MSKDMKHLTDDTMLTDDFVLIKIDSSPTKSIRHNVTCLLDLSDKILHMICGYLQPAYVLYSFYTPEKPELHLHRVIFAYYTKMKLDKITNDEYCYLSSLFRSSTMRPPLNSLILSNEHMTCLTRRYFSSIPLNIIRSVFSNLKHLTLIDCSLQDMAYFSIFNINLLKLEYLHITIQKSKGDLDIDYIPVHDLSMNKFLFNKPMPCLHTVCIEIPHGLKLSKSLTSHEILRNVNLILQTIDDLYVLLDGLVPNVQKMIIQLCQSRLLTCNRPKSTSTCSQLTEFTLLEPRIGLVISDIQCIFGSMPSLNKLTLSIRDTLDPLFCHGPSFESILTEYLPDLRQFHYTMTHRIVDEALIQDFIQWPMDSVFYENENSKWIHIYSLPWPSNKDDKRRLPIVKGGCMTTVRSDVKRAEYMDHVMITNSNEFIELKTKFYRACQITTCLSIDIELPGRIRKVILTKETPISSMKSLIQPSVRYLIVERRLIDEKEIFNLAHQFPNIEYLKLLFPFEKCSYIRCLKSIFTRNENLEELYIWPKLINFSTEICFQQLNLFYNDNEMYEWLIEHTDLKYHEYPFHVSYSFSSISISF